jgi:hypothetical protein
MKNNLKNNSSSESFGTLVIILAILAIFISVVGLGVVYIKTQQLKEKMTGNAVGYLNLSIIQEININNTNPNIDWGEGMVNTTGGFNYATLETGTGSIGTVTGGNWSDSGQTLAWNIVNIGNVNCSVTIGSRWTVDAAHQLFGGSIAYEGYWWKAMDNEAGSCNSGSSNYTQWAEANGSMLLCNNLGYIDSKDSIYIDVRLWVPYDANITTNKENRNDQVTISASTAS